MSYLKKKTHEYNQTKIIQPTQSIHYANCDEFQEKLHLVCPLKDAQKHMNLCENVSLEIIIPLKNFY